MSGMLTDGGPVERKIQLTGGSTYTVSIPKAWAEARDIRSGTSVSLFPFDDRIVVARPDDGTTGRTTTVNVDTVDDGAIGRRIVAAYAAGVDEVVVESDTGFDPAQRRLANRTITDLVGLEVQRETERELVARSLLDPAEVSLESTIDQLRQIALSMHETAIEAVTADGGTTDVDELAAYVVDRDDEADRLFALVCRQFYRVLVDVREVESLRTSRSTAFTQFRIARQLERVADHAELIATLATRQSSPPEPDLAERLDATAADARRVVRSALEGNTGEALLRRDDVVADLDDLDRELYEAGGADGYLYGRILESIRRTAEYGVNVAEATTLRDISQSGL